MKLTKLQRYTLYCILLEAIERGRYYPVNGFCALFLDEVGDDLLYESFKQSVPELYKKRTTGIEPDEGAAFYNWDERIKALKQCIEETHP